MRLRNFLLTTATTLVIITSCRTNISETDTKYNAGEHAWFGDTAFLEVCETKNLASNCKNRNKFYGKNLNRFYSYGEILAFADFFMNVETFYNVGKDSPIQYIWEPHNVEQVKGEFEKEKKIIERMINGEDIDYEYSDLAYWWYMDDYLASTRDNNSHFGWNNALRYIKIHEVAVNLAIQANSFKATQPGKYLEYANKALFFNAFADHYLTDGFAAGHIRVPIAQIKEAKERLDLTEMQAEVISNIFHEREASIGEYSCIESKQFLAQKERAGIFVKNSLNRTWLATGDGKVFQPGKQMNMGTERRIVINAVKASIEEISEIITDGKKPSQPYAALYHLPFPDYSQETPLHKKICSQMSNQKINQIISLIPHFMKIGTLFELDAIKLREVFKETPKLMESMRNQVKKDIREQNLKNKLPKLYMEQFKKIR